MTVSTLRLAIQGFQGRYTTYPMEVVDPSYNRNSGEFSVSITSERNGRSAIVNNAVAELYVNGTKIAEGSDAPSAYGGEWVTLTGTTDAQPPFDVEVVVTAPEWDNESGSGGFTFELPFQESAVTVTCEQGDAEITVGDQVAVPFIIENENSGAAFVSIGVTFGGATATIEATVPGGGSESVSTTFEPTETGQFTPTVSVSVSPSD